MPAQAEAQIGGRYRLEKMVGEGSSAQVWAAWDTVLSRSVALKLLRPKSDNEKSRIWREARLAALLGESVAVPIYDFGDDGEHCFLAMELVSEPSLREFLNSTPSLSPEAIISLAMHLLDALAKTHALSIVHRDVKPENLFVVGSSEEIERVRLVDFGLSFVQEASVQEASQASLGRLTDDTILSGTPAYLSPEQAKGGTINRESDIYSAGCVLYEVASGVPPFEGTLGEVLSKHIYVPPIPLRERQIALPDPFMDLVEAMLVKVPDGRVSAPDALAILEELVRDNASLQERRSDRAKRVSREERMVDSPSESETAEPNLDDTVNASLAGSPPAWLLDLLHRAGVAVVREDEVASVHFESAGVARTEGSPRPCVMWLDDLTTCSPAELIVRGADFAVSPETQPEKLARTLRRLSSPSADKRKA